MTVLLLEVRDLPTVNACLNATAALLLLCGFACIKTRRIAAHRAFMTSALAVSIVFLTCYVIYHASAPATRFTGTGALRVVYFAVLISHVVLAVAVVPLALVTFHRGRKGRYERHVALARWTFPIWMYVSVTGVVVYVMLYHL